jgi:glycosyltransferase involved in cell wall biosynthesis
MLVEAFAKVAPTDPELNLVMAGPDSQSWSATLKATAERAGVAHRIHWPGIILSDAKWGSFFASEAFILPSHQENFGIAVAEALGCATPVLLADKVNIAPDIAADGAGLMELDTPEGTLRLLERWIAMNPAERQTMARTALNTFHARYDMRENAITIIRLFESKTVRREQPVPTPQ